MFNLNQLIKLQNEVKNERETTVIVEGIKDKRVLEKIGFKNVIDISGKKIYQVAEMIGKEAIILTDFDYEGEKKASALTKLLQSRGVKINFLTRQKFKNLKIKKIEELSSLIKMEVDFNGKISSVYGKIFNRSRIFNRWSGRKTRHNWCNIRPD